MKCLDLEVVGEKRGAIELANLVVECRREWGKPQAGKEATRLDARRHDASRISSSSRVWIKGQGSGYSA